MDFKKPEISEKLRYAIETAIRTANDEGYAIIGVAFRANPYSIILLRNTKDNPADLLRVAADLVGEKVSRGLYFEEVVTPIN